MTKSQMTLYVVSKYERELLAVLAGDEKVIAIIVAYAWVSLYIKSCIFEQEKERMTRIQKRLTI